MILLLGLQKLARPCRMLWLTIACGSLSAGVVRAALPWPNLLVPAQDTALFIAVKLPAPLDPRKAWQLAESGIPGEALPAELISEPLADNRASASGMMLVATIPPRLGAEGVRRFQLIDSGLPKAGMEPRWRWAEGSNKSLELWEGARPVLAYQYGVQSKPGVPADRSRSTYLHPIHGLDGEVLTDDFPADHYHHRGLFWAWPHVRLGEQHFDLWDLRGIEQRFENWLDRRSGSASATLGIENGWYVGKDKVMQERVWLTVYPSTAAERVIDVDLTWIPLRQPVTLAGAEGKSYGGFTLRFAPRTNTVITTPLGNQPEDLTVTPLPWADLSAEFPGAPGRSGAAIFVRPDHPNYPPTWLTRHYGALCVGWPGVTPITFPANEAIHCRYRVWVHRGQPDARRVQVAYAGYENASRIRWAPPGAE